MLTVKKTYPTEYQECKAFWQFSQSIPMLREYLIKIVNEGAREAWYGRSLINIGLRPGLPDYFYPIPNSLWRGLWIEMKRKNGLNRKKTYNQENWIEKLMKVGYYATYAFGAEDAIDIYKKYTKDEI